ncbi:pseudouridine synthase [Hortaea werneckii]|nr:pseudouridine synthase [Hortaea werneckii]
MAANTGNSNNTNQDYTHLSHADLVTRVTELEQQLRTLNAKHTASSTTSSPAAPPKKKPKKPAKPFDPSKYNTRFIALKFAYLGGEYNGFEHHSNNTTPLPTVEEELWRGLRKTKLIFPDFTKVRGDEGEVCWDGVEYSKCGRTDRGVSAFGQVVGLRVRSSQPKGRKKKDVGGDGAAGEQGSEGMSNGGASAAPQSDSNTADASADAGEQSGPMVEPKWDSIRDELPYIQLLNRVLPPSIRILAWCPHPPQDFSARFSCKERRYRYFFTNPAYPVGPGSKDGLLNVPAMQEAAKKYEGLHDFRNFCKVDPSKQITNFERRIFSAGIHAVSTGGGQAPQGFAQSNGHQETNSVGQEGRLKLSEPELYYFEVRGSAFLWHQVRHLIAVLFLVGQGYEHPSIVDKLLDTNVCPSKPVYEMADDRPLVLWDCVFPDLEKLAEQQDHVVDQESGKTGYEDALDWIYVGDEIGGRDQSKRAIPGIDDGKFGRNGIMDELWAQWRQRKIDEVLAGHLMDVVSGLGSRPQPQSGDDANGQNGDDVLNVHKDLLERSDRVFDGSDRPRTVGTYIPVLQRERMETPDVVNARYAARKGLAPKATEMDLD